MFRACSTRKRRFFRHRVETRCYNISQACGSLKSRYFIYLVFKQRLRNMFKFLTVAFLLK
jgi:hypothetical protein